MFKIKIDPLRCNGCGECVARCFEGVFEIENKKAVAYNEYDCMGCALCIDVCEQNAIRLMELCCG